MRVAPIAHYLLRQRIDCHGQLAIQWRAIRLYCITPQIQLVGEPLNTENMLRTAIEIRTDIPLLQVAILIGKLGLFGLYPPFCRHCAKPRFGTDIVLLPQDDDVGRHLGAGILLEGV